MVVIFRYLYFVVINQSLVRLPLSVVNSAQSDTTLIDSAYILEMNNTTTAFTIDLADSQTFFTYGFFVRLSNLNGEVRATLDVRIAGDAEMTTKYLASYGSAAMISQPGVRIRDVQRSGNNVGVGFLSSGATPYTSVSLFQPAYQPLPGKPKAISLLYCTCSYFSCYFDVNFFTN